MKRVLAACLALMLLCGCAPAEKDLVGAWEREGDTLVLEADYTGEVSGSAIHWSMIEGNLLILFDGGAGSVEFEVELDGEDTLKLTTVAETSETAVFERVEE